MMGYLKSLSRALFLVFFIVSVVKPPAGYAEKQGSQYPKDMDFVLRSTVFEGPSTVGNREYTGFFLNQEIKGNISGFTKDQNGVNLVLEVTEINREFENPMSEEQVWKIQPFVAEVSVSQEDVPYTIDIVRGGGWRTIRRHSDSQRSIVQQT